MEVRDDLRSDLAAQNELSLRISELVAHFLYAHSLPFLHTDTQLAIAESADEFVGNIVDEYAPVLVQEPCAMSAAKYEAES
jgi:hypothetical protein